MNKKKEELTDLEKAFSNVVSSMKPTIDKHISTAATELAKACKIASEHGIPFQASISELGQAFVPRSFTKKFGELDPEFVSSLTDVYATRDDGQGWQYSAVC